MANQNDKLYQLLQEIQLDNFWPKLRDELQITQISHFDFVKPKDLEKIGMSKPAIRRLLDSVNKIKKTPIRPPPPPPTQKSSKDQNLTKPTSNIIKKITNSKIFDSSKPKNETFNSQSQSVIINANDIQILKSKDNDDILGKGHFGIVKRGIWKSPNNTQITVAVKCLHDNYFKSRDEDKKQAFLNIVNEVSCMCGLEHNNLIKLYGVVLNGENNGNGMIMMVTELAPHGSLLDFLRKNREFKKVALRQLYSYIFQISNGMEYLESKKVIHRDLAARNILLYTIEKIKICDFGMSRNVKNGFYTMTEASKIPCAWYPPESIREKLFSVKSDVWAFGVTIWEIFTFGEPPWPNMDISEILNKIDIEKKRLSIPYLCSKNFYKILLNCWSHNPADRPTFQSLKFIIRDTKIIEMKAKDSYIDDDRLEIERGDLITIIDGDAGKYFWKGQNSRTLLSGSFPRMILDAQRKLNSEDISMPLKNSFIHTGHMGIGKNDKTWGNPGKIDDIFLSNPQKPPDLLGNGDDENEIVENTIEIDNKSSKANSNFEDLLGIFDGKNEIKITYPDSSISLNSAGSEKSETSLTLFSLNDSFNKNLGAHSNALSPYYFNNNYIQDKFKNSDPQSYYNNIGNNNNQIHNYYNNNFTSYKQDNLNYNLNQEPTILKSPTKINSQSNNILKPTNPFLSNLNGPIYNQNFESNNNLVNKNQKSNHHKSLSPKFDSIKSEFKKESNKIINVDEFLNKQVDYFLNDVKNLKFQSK